MREIIDESSFLNMDLKPSHKAASSSTSRYEHPVPKSSSNLSGTQKRLSQALNETNKLMLYHSASQSRLQARSS